MRTAVGAIDTPSTVSTSPPKLRRSLTGYAAELVITPSHALRIADDSSSAGGSASTTPPVLVSSTLPTADSAAIVDHAPKVTAVAAGRSRRHGPATATVAPASRRRRDPSRRRRDRRPTGVRGGPSSGGARSPRNDRRDDRWRRRRGGRGDGWQRRRRRSRTRHAAPGPGRPRGPAPEPGLALVHGAARRWRAVPPARRRHWAGATTLWLRLGRELADGRMLNASEITSAITPATKMMITLIAAKNGVRLRVPAPAAPKSGYMPVVKSSVVDVGVGVGAHLRVNRGRVVGDGAVGQRLGTGSAAADCTQRRPDIPAPARAGSPNRCPGPARRPAQRSTRRTAAHSPRPAPRRWPAPSRAARARSAAATSRLPAPA